MIVLPPLAINVALTGMVLRKKAILKSFTAHCSEPQALADGSGCTSGRRPRVGDSVETGRNLARLSGSRPATDVRQCPSLVTDVGEIGSVAGPGR
jgi:hypothetical protein